MDRDINIWQTVPGLILLLPIIVLYGDSWRPFGDLGAGLLTFLVTWGVGYLWHLNYRVWFESWLGGDGFARQDRQVLRVLLADGRELESAAAQQYTRKDYWQAFLAREHIFYTADWPHFVQHNKDQWHYIFAYRMTASACLASALVCLPSVLMDVADVSGCLAWLLIFGLFVESILSSRKASQMYRSLNLQEEMAVRMESRNPASNAPHFRKALVFSRQISPPRREFWLPCPAPNPCCRLVIGLVLVGLISGMLGYGVFKLSPRCSNKTSTTQPCYSGPRLAGAKFHNFTISLRNIYAR
jgi:hypothetical protein